MKRYNCCLALMVLLLVTVSARADPPAKPGNWQAYAAAAADSFSFSPLIVIDQSGRTVMAYSRYESLNSGINTVAVYVKRWDGEQWQSLGTFINERRHHRAGAPSLAIGHDNQPFIAWYEEVRPNHFAVYAKHWNGDTWESLGMLNDTTGDAALAPLIAVDQYNVPHVAFRQFSNATGIQLRVKRYDGTQWQSVGDRYISDGTPTGIAIDQKGVISIVYQEETEYGVTQLKVKRWNGYGWWQPGSVLNDYMDEAWLDASLALSPSGRLHIGWREFDDILQSYIVRVVRWDWRTRDWEDFPDTADKGTEQVRKNVKLLIQGHARPVIAWQDQTDQSVHVQAWNWYHRDWQDLGSDFLTGVNRGFDLAMDTDGTLFLGYGTHPGHFQGDIYMASFQPQQRNKALTPLTD